MLNKIKVLFLGLLALSITSYESLSLLAQKPFLGYIVDNYGGSSDNNNFGVIEEFIVKEKELNSTLHPNFDYLGKEIYYSTNDSNGYHNEWIFDDVFYSYDSHRVMELESGEIITENSLLHSASSTIFSEDVTNTKYYSSYIGELDHKGMIMIDGVSQKVGFSSIDGVSLLSNDIYLNTTFSEDLKEKNNIDLALKNTSDYKINWLDLFNKVSNAVKMYCNDNDTSEESYYSFQYPLIKIDGDEFVNVVFCSQGAYIVSHNSNFSISEDGSTIYLELPYMKYIEKITFSVPFFTGCFTQYLTSSDFDKNYYPNAYLVGEEIINEIYSVMTGFEPYLYNNDSNYNGTLYSFNPFQVVDIDKYNKKIVIQSANNISATIKSFDINVSDYVTTNIMNDIPLTYESTDLTSISYLNNIIYSYEEFNKYTYSFNYDIALNNTCTINVSDLKYNINSDTYSLKKAKKTSSGISEQFSGDFLYNKDKASKIIMGRYEYHYQANPSFWEYLIFNPIWGTYKPNDHTGYYIDQFNSVREMLYIDFYWDMEMNNRIESIDSIYMVLPKADGTSVVLKQNSIQSYIENPFNEDYYFYNLYNSDIDGYYNEFFMVTPTSELVDENDLFANYYFFNKHNIRFMYSHYNGKYDVDEAPHRLDNEAIEKDSSSVYAQLSVTIGADSITKCTTADNGLHLEYDDTGKLIGIFNQYGEIEEDYQLNSNGYIENKNTGEAVKNQYDYKDIQELFDSATLNYNGLLGGLTQLINNIGSFFNDLSNVAIMLVSFVGIVVAVFVIIRVLSLFNKSKKKKIRHGKK